jgi:2-polyprenyl-3-methyl-5-hydroxy-6-metoxy-1,4-benzoquinol methylase
MRKNKYYDWFRTQPLSKEDGCKFEDWAQGYAHHPFAIHPKGFLIFLHPDEIEETDEYSEGDPYRVKAVLEGEFQQGRIALTLQLLTMAFPDKPRNIKLLDLGCGEGHITGKILEAFANAEVSGLDRSFSAIGSAVSYYSGIDFCVADAYQPPYQKEYFDAVVCNNLWEHVPDPVFLLSKIRRIIKPGGHLIISTPSRYRTKNLARVLIGKSVSLRSVKHVTEYSVGQVIEQLRFRKFLVEKICSRPIKGKLTNLNELFGYRLLPSIINCYLRLVKSHHSLDGTVFFLARKLSD